MEKRQCMKAFKIEIDVKNILLSEVIYAFRRLYRRKTSRHGYAMRSKETLAGRV